MVGRLFVDCRRSKQGEIRLPIPLPVTKTRPVEPDSRTRKAARKSNRSPSHSHQHDQVALFWGRNGTFAGGVKGRSASLLWIDHALRELPAALLTETVAAFGWHSAGPRPPRGLPFRASVRQRTDSRQRSQA
ncbi:MAG: hypothetical protein RLZZ440_1029 [Planctomycetota bacterium]